MRQGHGAIGCKNKGMGLGGLGSGKTTLTSEEFSVIGKQSRRPTGTSPIVRTAAMSVL